MVGGGPLQHDLVGLLVGRPQLALVEVAGVVLPELVRPLQAFGQPCLLFVEGDEHGDLDDRGARVDQFLLEGVDLVVAAFKLVGGHQLMHPHDQHVLEVRPVEHPDVSGRRQCFVEPPEEVVGALLRRRLAEAVVVDAHGISGGHHMGDDPSLSGGVHALQYQQHRAVVALAGVCVEHLLQLGKVLFPLDGDLFGIPALALEPG